MEIENTNQVPLEQQDNHLRQDPFNQQAQNQNQGPIDQPVQNTNQVDNRGQPVAAEWPDIQPEDTQKSLSYDKVRIGFIRKVYTILAMQLIFTALFSTLTIFNQPTQDFLRQNVYIFYIAIGVNLITFYALFCYRQNARTVPRNYILLALFTLSEAIMVGYVTMMSYPMDVLIALILTAVMVVGLTIYAMTTTTDFTIMGGLFFIIGITLIGMSILSFFIRNKIFTIVISSICVVFFGLYLIYDTQLIIGKKENALSADDYIIGALSLYIDIVTIFLHILQILNASN